MLYEKRLGPRSCRFAHLLNLPDTEDLETFLAWPERDLEALRGSSWLGEIRKRRATISDDFSELRMELGTALAELNVTEDGFMWAHQVLAQFAVHFVVDDGSILTALVPGLVQLPGSQFLSGERALEFKLASELVPMTLDTDRRALNSSVSAPNVHHEVDLREYGVLIIPLLFDSSQSNTSTAVSQVLLFLQILFEQCAGDHTICVVFITSETNGPLRSSSTRPPSPVCAVRGLIRCVQLEAKQLQILSIDSDQLHGDYMLASEQVRLEVSAIRRYTEVAYRAGRRYVPCVDLSTRNPLRPVSVLYLSSAVASGTVVISGGLGGLGIVTAEALVEIGARTIVLCGRSGRVRSGQGLHERLDALRAGRGIRIIEAQCDMAEEVDVTDLLQCARQLGPITAVVHAAGVLADSLFLMQTPETVKEVFAPKADGVWFLHKHTLGDDLKAFIAFSSTASLTGNLGQANYAAANMYMEELCRWRAAQGLPGTAVQWPAVAEVGMAADLSEKARVAQDMEVDVMHVKHVVKLLFADNREIQPVQAVLPEGYLAHTPQPAMFERLLARGKVTNTRSFTF